MSSPAEAAASGAPEGAPGEAVLSGFAALDAALRAAVATVAAADPAPTDPLRGLYITDDAALQTARGLDGARLDDRMAVLAEALSLDAMDAAILGLCLAPEADPSYGRLIGYLHDDVTRRRPSPRLLARLLADSSRPEPVVLERLGARAPLRATGALRLDEADPLLPLAERPLTPDPLLVGFALGAELERASPPAGVTDVARRAVGPWPRETLATLRRAALDGAGPVLGITGPDAEQALAEATGGPVVVATRWDPALLARATLRARLTGATLALGGGAAGGPAREGGEEAPPREDLAALRDALRAGLGPEGGDGPGGRGGADTRAGGPDTPRGARILLGDDVVAAAARAGVPVHVVDVPALAGPERAAAWAAHLGEVPAEAARFPLSRTEIADAALLARAHADGPLAAEHVLAAGRRMTATAMGGLARRLEPVWSWDDLVLPADEHATLRSIAAHLRHRDVVLGDWGFDSTEAAGLTVMFSGQSGTGKTMAAAVLAADLGVEAYRVDVSSIVSKYIGETEKNLERLFRAADGLEALLVFDEADALFGKRSAVSDARDRYANLEVAYLLQRIEAHAGASILTTNLRQNIDQAFLRRMDFIVEFPVPRAAERLAIWQRHVPADAPLADDVDLAALADEHELPGGSIRNCLRAAAFAAAGNGGAISMTHLREAVRLELRKLGRLGPAGTLARR